MKDKTIQKLIDAEKQKQNTTVNLIASENIASDDVLEALGSVLTNKYSEGYPGKRYYGGNQFIDKIETLCQDRALRLFNLKKNEWSVNVQPYSGSPANFATYLSLVPVGGKILGMSLDSGGHLTHGHPASHTGKVWKSVQYTVNKDTHLLDYDEIERIVAKEKPDIIVTGYSGYSRKIDFIRFRHIADKVGALLMADISHIAGLVAAQEHMSPFPYADVVTTTTQKTLRGPRGALIFSRNELSNKIDKSIMPGFQGGPHNNNIAAIAVCLFEAANPKFKTYIKNVINNARVLSSEFQKNGFKIITGGTDNHMFLIDTVSSIGLTGDKVEKILEDEYIIVNKNAIPFDSNPPTRPSGIRIGTAAVTSLGWKSREMRFIAKEMISILRDAQQSTKNNNRLGRT